MQHDALRVRVTTLNAWGLWGVAARRRERMAELANWLRECVHADPAASKAGLPALPVCSRICVHFLTQASLLLACRSPACPADLVVSLHCPFHTVEQS